MKLYNTEWQVIFDCYSKLELREMVQKYVSKYK